MKMALCMPKISVRNLACDEMSTATMQDTPIRLRLALKFFKFLNGNVFDRTIAIWVFSEI